MFYLLTVLHVSYICILVVNLQGLWWLLRPAVVLPLTKVNVTSNNSILHVVLVYTFASQNDDDARRWPKRFVTCQKLCSFNVILVLYPLSQKHGAYDEKRETERVWEKRQDASRRVSIERDNGVFVGVMAHRNLSSLPLTLHCIVRCCQHSNVRRHTVETHHEPTSQRTTTTTHYKLITDGAESMSTLIIRRRSRAACNYGRKFYTVATNTI